MGPGARCPASAGNGRFQRSFLGGSVLIAAGFYQWTPVKDACLAQCQSPFLFLQRHGGFRAAYRRFARARGETGIYCIGCCWALMLLLFVGGIMNVAWIAAIAILVLLEKVTPWGRMLARAFGSALVLGGVWLIVGGFGETPAACLLRVSR